MSRRIIASQARPQSLRRHHAIGSHVKDLNAGFSPQTGKDMRRLRRCSWHALGAHMVERSVVADLDFEHPVKARRPRAVFQQRNSGTGVQLDDACAGMTSAVSDVGDR